MPQPPKKPKPLRDIRYFESRDAPDAGQPFPAYASKLFAVPKPAIALGQRIAMKCEELGVSIGRADHLYLCFTPALPEGAAARTDYAIEPWHRFALYGLGPSFNARPDAAKLAEITEATFRTLADLAPESAAVLASLRASIEAEGEALRVCIRRKETRRYAVRVEQTVPVHPRPTPIFVTVTDLSTQRTGEVKVAEVRFPDEAPSLVARLAITGNVLTIHPRASFRAELVAKPYQVPFQVDLAELFGA